VLKALLVSWETRPIEKGRQGQNIGGPYFCTIGIGFNTMKVRDFFFR